MKTLIKLLLAIIFPFQLINSQSIDSLWMYYYDDVKFDYTSDIVQKYDSGYIVVGNTWLGTSSPCVASFNKDGQLLWNKQFVSDYLYDGFRNIIKTSDSNYLIGGGYNDFAWLVKMNGEGDTLWTKSFGENFGMITCMEELANKDLVITGYAADHSEDFYLMKTNQYGDTIWTRKYIFEEDFHWVTSRCVKQTLDGGYIISAYYSGGYGNPYSIFVKTDSNGDTLWTKDSLHDLDVNCTKFTEILIDHDTIYFIGGGFLQEITGIIVIKLKPEEIEYLLIKDVNVMYPFCTGTFTDNGTIMLAADLSSTTQYRISAIEIDKNGNILWENVFGEFVEYYQARQILETFENDYVISGMKSSNIAFLMKFGENPSSVKKTNNAYFIEFAVSPNPITTFTTINFIVSEKGTYTISVYDLNGNKIKILVEKEFACGSYKYPLNIGEFSNGVYIIKIGSGSFKRTQKIVVAR